MTAPAGLVVWQDVVALDALEPDRGVAVLVADDQLALFCLSGGGEVLAIGNLDPFSGAAVLARGIVGDRHGEPVVASPVYKQLFSLRSGRCLDDPTIAVPVYQTRVIEGRIEIAAKVLE